MDILFLGNNWLGWKTLRHLVHRGESIVGLVVHPEQEQKYGEEILGTVSLDEDRIFRADRLDDRPTRKNLEQLKPDLGISVLLGYVVPPRVLSIPDEGMVNLHPAYLPYNRGNYPNVWSIVEETPAGVTLHYMDKTIDTGDVIARRKVPVEPVDTGKSLYHKLEVEAYRLFVETWPDLREGDVSACPQESGGTYYHSDDVESIDEIDLDEEYRARDLLNVLRARTFPPHESAYFVEEGRKIYVEVDLKYGQD